MYWENRRNIKSIILSTLICLFILFCNNQSVFADSDIEKSNPTEQTKNDVGFTVEIEKTNTQIDESKSFFFIRTKPNEQQQLKVKIRSTNVAPVTVTVAVKEGYTNQNGAIDYDGTSYKKDDTLVNSVEKLSAIAPQEVTVENYETKEVTLTITPPKESYDGVKLGAICVMKKEKKEKKAAIQSTFGYRVGLVLSEKEDRYDDGSSLNLLSTKATVEQGKRVIQAQLQNPEAKVLKNLTVKTTFRKKGEKEVLKSRELSNIRMAPNSQFSFMTDWGVDAIEPGKYVLSVDATSGKNKWNWEEEITIGEKQAKQINKEATYTLTYPKWVPWVALLVIVASLCTVFYLVFRRRQWREGDSD